MTDTSYTIIALDNGLVDLDEFECCESLRQRINADCPSTVTSIILDLRRCWIEYSHSFLFFDEALSKLQHSSESEIVVRQLVVRTSIDLGSPELMVVLLFRLSNNIACERTDTPTQVMERIRSFCASNKISIDIESYQNNASADGGCTRYSFTGGHDVVHE